MWFSGLLSTVGRLDEALAEIQRAQELDPLSRIILANVGFRLYAIGQDGLATEAMGKGLALDPDFALFHANLGLIHLGHSRFEEALTEFQRVRATGGHGPFGLGLLGHAYARMGNQVEALGILAQLERFDAEGFAVYFDLARIHHGPALPRVAEEDQPG
jgi:Flp pilus assembly protein TadD